MAGSERPQETAGREPRFLTVEEAAAALRIGRTSAYALVKRWLATSGREGIPAVRLGKTIRVPQAAIERLARGVAASGAGE